MDPDPTRPSKIRARSCIRPMDVDEIMVIPDTPDKTSQPLRTIRGVSTLADSGLRNSVPLNKGIVDRSQLYGGTVPNKGVQSRGHVISIVPSSSSKNASSSNDRHMPNDKGLCPKPSRLSHHHMKSNGPDLVAVKDDPRNRSKGKSKIGDDKHNSGSVSSGPQCARLPSKTTTKSLVRNGCISPQNIAKTMELAESSSNGHANTKRNSRFVASHHLIDVDEINANENVVARAKGKGVASQPVSYGGCDVGLNETVSDPLPQLNEGTRPKRQRRHDPASSSNTEKSPDVICLTSGVESLTRRTNIHQRESRSPIGVIELSHETRESASQIEAREIQLQLDEMMARDLQEQLYNEIPDDTGGSERLFPAPNSRRPPQSQSSRSRVLQRGTQARAPRARSRINTRARNFSFGIGVFEAMGAFFNDGFGMVDQLTDFDFDESHYEMLLALDENNHEHLGASAVQIASLPQSTVHNNEVEDCSICLETPAIGDTIRHLPCLHKFHKDCIDQWLSRKRSCPVCKSDVV